MLPNNDHNNNNNDNNDHNSNGTWDVIVRVDNCSDDDASDDKNDYNTKA